MKAEAERDLRVVSVVVKVGMEECQQSISWGVYDFSYLSIDALSHKRTFVLE